MSMMNMAGYEDAVRTRAYYMWESEGCPFGRDVEHWHASEAEFRRQDEIAAQACAETRAEPVKVAAAPAGVAANVVKPKAKAAKTKVAKPKVAATSRKKAASSLRAAPAVEYTLQ